MSWIRRTTPIALLFLPAAGVAQNTDESAVRAVATAFGTALAAGDSLSAIALLHPDVVIFENGTWESLEEYRQGHLRADMQFLQGLKREIVRDSVTISGDLALVTRSSSTTGTAGARAIDSLGAETMVLMRTASGWKIRHIHWSSRARRRPGD